MKNALLLLAVLAPSHRSWIENRLTLADAWRSGASFETFQAEVFHE